MNEAAQFLRTLFGSVPPQYALNLWTLADKKSQWFEPAEIDRVAEEVHGKKNVYVGVSFIDKNETEKKGDFKRITLKDSSGLVGLWADIDYGDEGHKPGHKIPPTQEDAIKLLDELPMPASIIIHSGNGLHAWWLFESPLIFTNDAQREAGKQLEQNWMDTIRAYAQRFGWDIDSTYDVSRVLRVPGTINAKPNATEKTAHILRDTGKRYKPEDFQDKTEKPERRSLADRINAAPISNIGDISFREDAVPPRHKFVALAQLDEKFSRSYTRNRADAAMKDKSNSGYDLSLAAFAVRANWTDQEIVDLLIASRRDTGNETKINEGSYYLRTIQRARSSISVRGENPNMDAVEELAATINETGADRPEVLHIISGALEGVTVTRIVRYVSSPPNRYSIETEQYGAIDLGGIENIMGQAAFRNRFADLCKIVLPKFKDAAWNKLCQLMLNAAEDEDVGESAADSMRAWVDDYLATRHPTMEIEDAALRRWPLLEGDKVYFYIDNFRNWLELKGLAYKQSDKELGTQLRKIGIHRVTKAVTIENKKTTRSLWEVRWVEGD